MTRQIDTFEIDMEVAAIPGTSLKVSRVAIGWQLDASVKAEIDRILRETIIDPVGPEFMAPPARNGA